MKFHHFCPPLEISLASPGKIHYFPLEKILPTPMYTTLDYSWTIGKPHCFDEVRLKAEVGKVLQAVSLICTEVFLRLTHQMLDLPEYFCCNFRNREKLPPSSPL